MNTTLKIILVIIGVLFISFVSIKIIDYFEPHTKPILANTMVIRVDSTLQHGLKISNDSLKNVADQNLYKAKNAKSIELTLRKTLEKQGVELDTLRSFYVKHHTLRVADSVIVEQSDYIDSLTEDNKLILQRADYCDIALMAERKRNVNNDTIIASKERVIQSYVYVINKSNCINNWTDKHRFWSWLLGIKCK
jgi:hypothetical protein